MALQRQEIRTLIVACERIHAVLANGQKYTEEEQAVIDFCLCELLSKLREAPAEKAATQ